MLPNDFLERMKEMLSTEDYSAFVKSYEQEKSYGLRINPLKWHLEDVDRLPFSLTQIPWFKEGFYANPDEHPGKHPLHEGGAYYIQEPSAMSVVSLLNPSPGDIVCDLCAAPGGKSTQIAGRLLGEGLLVSNEIFPARAKVLSQNIERLGVTNCIVCNEPPDRMAKHFPNFFTKIVVDAPCSGEGMFRKDETAQSEWSLEQVQICKERQQMILKYADTMLAPDGILVYSTCTFAPAENEEIIAWFLDNYPDYSLEDWKTILPANYGISDGQPEFSGNRNNTLLRKTMRLWPHKLNGEGHFVARLHKASTPVPAQKKQKNKKKTKKAASFPDYDIFCEKFLNPIADSENTSDDRTITPYRIGKFLNSAQITVFGEELYLIPNSMKKLDGIKIVRAGLHLGTLKKNRFEPSHSFAVALSKKDVRQLHECNYDEAQKYLSGETLSCDTSLKSWTLICYEGISLGWGKAQNGVLKNHYPKGLRIMK